MALYNDEHMINKKIGVSGIGWWIIMLVTPILLSCGSDTQPLFEPSIVWEAGEKGMDGYRIPGIVIAKDGTALAFSEERPDYKDEAPKSLVVKRSNDKGKTWSQNIYIEKSDGEFWAANEHLIDSLDVKDKKEVWTNVAPIVDYVTGKVFFFYSLSEGTIAGQNIQRYTRVFYRVSADHGKTWSERNEITSLLHSKKGGSPNKDSDGNWVTDENGFACDYLGRAFHMPGPGHGIQLENGRLLLQLWNRKALGILGEGQIPADERQYGISTIYSDDGGQIWNYGSSFGHDGRNMNESRLAELHNGDVYVNARYTEDNPGDRNNHRAVAISKDQGVSWQNILIDENFPKSNQCDAGLIAIPQNNGDNKNILLYSKNESTEGRENLTVRLSFDEGKSWPVSRVVDEGPAWYSDMALLPDHTVLLIYETGKDSPVKVVRFNLDWLNEEDK
ncbi:MAG: sialidase family protein [Cyclobacteriaceae bacterium]